MQRDQCKHSGYAVVVVAVAALFLAAGAAVADHVGGLDPAGDNYLSLRTGPGSGYAEILRMGPDTPLTVLQSSGKWRRVRLPDGTEGWAYGAYVLPGDPPEPAPGPPPPEPDVAGMTRGMVGWVTARNGGRPDLLKAPDRAAPRIAPLHAGSGLIILAQSGDWLRVLTETGEVGFVAADWISAEPQPKPDNPQPDSPPPDLWQTYRNDRFGTLVRYPAALLFPQPAPENDDGRRFLSADGSVEALVYGQYNVFDQTIDALYDEDLAAGLFDRVTYQRTSARWYVLSGFNGGRVIYRKVLLSADGSIVHVLQISYPAVVKPMMDPVVEAMAASFSD